VTLTAGDQKPLVQAGAHVVAAMSERRRRVEAAAAALAAAAAAAVSAAASYVPTGGDVGRKPHVARPQIVGAGVGGVGGAT
jgi:hypothetical protein